MAAGGAGGRSRTLSRDFKHVRRHAPGKGSQSFSGWLGLGVGLAVGLSVALGVFLHYRGQPPAEPRPEPKAAPQSDVATDDAAAAATPSESPAGDLTFYDLLKNQQVEVPPDASVKPGAGHKTALPKGDVVLQAGSFKQEAEAEKMVAKLALAGIESKIQRFPMEDETWYRVRIGPISTVQELETVRNKLAAADIDVAPVMPTSDAPPP